MEVPSTKKGWHPEFLMVKGGDLGYLPEYHRLDGVTDGVRRTERLDPAKIDMAKRFAGVKPKGLWNEAHF